MLIKRFDCTHGFKCGNAAKSKRQTVSTRSILSHGINLAMLNDNLMNLCKFSATLALKVKFDYLIISSRSDTIML
jgi:hypothetical protein